VSVLADADLVGRDIETQQVRDALEEIVHGRPSLLLVGGDAGIGKSALADVAAGFAAARGFTVLTGRCLDGATDAGLAPVLDALGPLLRREADARDQRLDSPAAEILAQLLPAAGRAAIASFAPGQVLECVREVLVQAADREPVLLVLEDVHWAGQSTRDALVALSALRDRALAVLITYRTDDVGRRHPLRRCLRQLRRAAHCVPVTLGPLDDLAARELAARLGGPGVQGLDLGVVSVRSGGNPLYLLELVAAHRRGDGRLVPPGLADLFLSRLDDLAAATVEVLRVASVGGTVIDALLLEAVASESPAALDAALREAVDANLLVRRGDLLAFRHALLRDAIYGDVLPAELLRAHARYGDAVRRRIAHAAGPASAALEGDAGGMADWGLLAYHLAAAGDLAGALPAAVHAGREAARLGLPEAVTHLERVLGWWGQVLEPEGLAGMSRAELLCLAAAPVATAGDPGRAHELLAQALELVDVDREPLLASRIYAVRADHVAAAVGDPKEQQVALDRAVAYAEGTTSPELAHALAVAASYQFAYHGRNREARRLAARAQEVARAVGADADEAMAALLVALSQLSTGELDEGLADAQAAMDRFERSGPASDVLLYAGVYAFSLGASGHPEDGIALAQRSAQRAAALGLPAAQFYCTGADIFLSGRVGRLAEAEQLIAALLSGWQPGLARAVIASVVAELWTRRGDHPAALEAFEEVRAYFEGPDAAGNSLGDLSPMIDVYLALGRPDDAAELAAQVANACDDLDGDLDLATLARRTLAAVAAVRVDHRTVHEDLLSRGERFLAAARDVPGGCRWGTAGAGELAAADAWHAACTGAPTLLAWQQCREAWQATGFEYDALEATMALASAGFAEGERDTGQQALRAAWATSRRIGANGITRAAAALARRTRTSLEAGTTTSGGAGAGLTGRERQVLSLVAAGRSNPQIATELFLARKTASAHVSRILAKLGVASRGEAAAYAWAHGLAGPDEPAGR
jgi:DNA-binding CsgD family transcriptional regulator